MFQQTISASAGAPRRTEDVDQRRSLRKLQALPALLRALDDGGAHDATRSNDDSIPVQREGGRHA